MSLKTWKMLSPDTAPKCDTGLNIVFNHCAIRNLFLNCPSKNPDPTCDALIDFGKKCKAFPTENKYKNQE